MNYFEWFGLEPAIEIDLQTLKTQYLVLQQQHHPDHHSADYSQSSNALEKSSDINNAYECLKAPDTRAAYLLKLAKQDHGLEQSIHDFEFLQTALELREQLDDATQSSHLQQLRHEVAQWVESLLREFKIDYQQQDWAEARDTVRKLKFFKHVLIDIDKAEDRLVGDIDFDDTNFDDFEVDGFDD